MLVRFLEEQPAVSVVYTSKDIKKNLRDINILSESDVSKVKEMEIYKPMKIITTVLCNKNIYFYDIPIKTHNKINDCEGGWLEICG